MRTFGVTTFAPLTKISPPEVIVIVTLVPCRVAMLEPFMNDVLYMGSSDSTIWYSRIWSRSLVDMLATPVAMSWNALQRHQIRVQLGIVPFGYLLSGAKIVAFRRPFALPKMSVLLRAPYNEDKPAATRVDDTFCGSVRTPSMT